MKTVINIICAIYWVFIVNNVTWIMINFLAPVTAIIFISAVLAFVLNITTISIETFNKWD